MEKEITQMPLDHSCALAQLIMWYLGFDICAGANVVFVASIDEFIVAGSFDFLDVSVVTQQKASPFCETWNI